MNAAVAGVPTMSIAEGGSFGTPSQIEARYVNAFQWLDDWMKADSIALHTFRAMNLINRRQFIAITVASCSSLKGIAQETANGAALIVSREASRSHSEELRQPLLRRAPT